MDRLWHMPGKILAAALVAAPWRHWIQAIGALTFTIVAVAILLIVWKGGWTTGSEDQRLDILGGAVLIFGLLTALNVIALTDLAVNLRARGVEFSAASDDRQGPKPLPAAQPDPEADDDLPPDQRVEQ